MQNFLGLTCFLDDAIDIADPGLLAASPHILEHIVYRTAIADRADIKPPAFLFVGAAELKLRFDD